MNYLDGYVEEVLSEPYYDDYGSGIFRWWVKVSYVCCGIGAVTTKEEFDKAPVVGYIIEGVGLVFTDRGGHEVNA